MLRDIDIGRISREAFAYADFALRRFWSGGGMQAASSLTYTTLLSLVPLLAIAFAIFAAFPAFERAREQLESAIFTNLVPGTGGEVQEYLNNFLHNTGQLGSVGVVALGLSALLLLSTIEATFNRIWRVERPRPLVIRFLMYWGVLTLGPLLIGAGITLTTDVFSVARQGLSQAGVDAGQFTMEAGGLGDQLISVLLQTALFTILFAVVPNRRVAWRDALIGGFVGGAGFQILKVGFAAYLANVFTYQTIYGAMAVFPIFLIWLYLSWCVVLLGATFAASFSQWGRSDPSSPIGGRHPGETLARAIRILAILKRASRDGTEVAADQLGAAAGGVGADEIVAAMHAGRFTAVTESGAYVLIRDLTAATVFDLYQCLNLAVSPDPGDAGARTEPTPIDSLIIGLCTAEREVLNQALDDIVEAVASAVTRDPV